MAVEIRIVTPTQVPFEGSADEVQAPGFVGEFGVLPNHVDFLAVVRPGVVTVLANGSRKRFVVGRGFAEVGAGHLNLLTELCEPAEGVDKGAAQTLLEDSERLLAKVEPGTAEHTTAQRNADLARARLAV